MLVSTHQMCPSPPQVRIPGQVSAQFNCVMSKVGYMRVGFVSKHHSYVSELADSTHGLRGS